MKLDEVIHQLQTLRKEFDGKTEVEVFIPGLQTTLQTLRIKGVKKYNFKNASRNSPAILLEADE